MPFVFIEKHKSVPKWLWLSWRWTLWSDRVPEQTDRLPSPLGILCRRFGNVETEWRVDSYQPSVFGEKAEALTIKLLWNAMTSLNYYYRFRALDLPSSAFSSSTDPSLGWIASFGTFNLGFYPPSISRWDSHPSIWEFMGRPSLWVSYPASGDVHL